LVLLTKWSDIDLSKIQKESIESELSLNTIALLRTFESVFEGNTTHVQAHQCIRCGNFFMIGEDNVNSLKDDEEGGKLCKNCAGQKDPNVEKNVRWKKLAELTYAIKDWERTKDSSGEGFEKIKEIAKGFFEFDSEREMYVNYHKLKEKVDEDHKEFGSRLNVNYVKIIDELFTKAKEENTDEFVKFIFGINAEEVLEITETLHMLQASIVRGEMEYWLPKITEQITLLIGIKTKEQLDRLRLKFQLLQYGQLVEFGFIYDTLYNLAMISQNKKFIQNPFPPDKNGNPIFPSRKILLLEQENKELGKIVREYYVGPLRNAIAHAKYLIRGGFVLKSDKKNWKMSIKLVEDKNKLVKSISRYLYSKLIQEQVSIMEKGLTGKNKDTWKVSFSDNK